VVSPDIYARCVSVVVVINICCANSVTALKDDNGYSTR